MIPIIIVPLHHIPATRLGYSDIPQIAQGILHRSQSDPTNSLIMILTYKVRACTTLEHHDELDIWKRLLQEATDGSPEQLAIPARHSYARNHSFAF